MSTYYISDNGNDANDGSQANPWRTLQHANDNASNGDTISIIAVNGEYTLPAQTTISKQLDLTTPQTNPLLKFWMPDVGNFPGIRLATGSGQLGLTFIDFKAQARNDGSGELFDNTATNSSDGRINANLCDFGVIKYGISDTATGDGGSRQMSFFNCIFYCNFAKKDGTPITPTTISFILCYQAKPNYAVINSTIDSNFFTSSPPNPYNHFIRQQATVPADGIVGVRYTGTGTSYGPSNRDPCWFGETTPLQAPVGSVSFQSRILMEFGGRSGVQSSPKSIFRLRFIADGGWLDTIEEQSTVQFNSGFNLSSFTLGPGESILRLESADIGSVNWTRTKSPIEEFIRVEGYPADETLVSLDPAPANPEIVRTFFVGGAVPALVFPHGVIEYNGEYCVEAQFNQGLETSGEAVYSGREMDCAFLTQSISRNDLTRDYLEIPLRDIFPFFRVLDKVSGSMHVELSIEYTSPTVSGKNGTFSQTGGGASPTISDAFISARSWMPSKEVEKKYISDILAQPLVYENYINQRYGSSTGDVELLQNIQGRFLDSLYILGEGASPNFYYGNYTSNVLPLETLQVNVNSRDLYPLSLDSTPKLFNELKDTSVATDDSNLNQMSYTGKDLGVNDNDRSTSFISGCLVRSKIGNQPVSIKTFSQDTTSKVLISRTLRNCKFGADMKPIITE